MLHAYAWGYKLILLKVCIQILKFLEQNGNYLKLQMCKLQFNLKKKKKNSVYRIFIQHIK